MTGLHGRAFAAAITFIDTLLFLIRVLFRDQSLGGSKEGNKKVMDGSNIQKEHS